MAAHHAGRQEARRALHPGFQTLSGWLEDRPRPYVGRIGAELLQLPRLPRLPIPAKFLEKKAVAASFSTDPEAEELDLPAPIQAGNAKRISSPANFTETYSFHFFNHLLGGREFAYGGRQVFVRPLDS